MYKTDKILLSALAVAIFGGLALMGGVKYLEHTESIKHLNDAIENGFVQNMAGGCFVFAWLCVFTMAVALWAIWGED